jgi:hypothetical protein
MYYAEKIIDGVLHYRITPDGPWKTYTPEQLTDIIVQRESSIIVLRKRLKEADDLIIKDLSEKGIQK